MALSGWVLHECRPSRRYPHGATLGTFGAPAACETARAMSQEYEEIVRRLFEFWTRGDFRSGIEFFDPQIEFEMDASVTPFGQVKVRGVAEMRSAWRENLSGWGDLRVGGITRLVETEGNVVAFTRLQGRGRRSGIVIDQPDRAAIFTFRENRIARLRLTNVAEALEVAGLLK